MTRSRPTVAGSSALVDSEVGPKVLGYVMQVHCPGGGEDGDPDSNVTVVDHVKLIRNRPELRFEGRVHEQILPAIRRAGGTVAWTDLYVVHSGSDPSPEAQERKRRRDLHLLHLELREQPHHPFTLFNIGMTYADGGRFEEADEFLRRSIRHSAPDESHLRKAYALLVYAEMRQGRRDEALATCRRGLDLFPQDVELRFREGVVLHELGRLEEAAQAYRTVLAVREGRHFTSIDLGLTGFKARQNLAVVYTDLGGLDPGGGRVAARNAGRTALPPGLARPGRGLAPRRPIPRGLIRRRALPARSHATSRGPSAQNPAGNRCRRYVDGVGRDRADHRRRSERSYGARN